jgi:hypothetical protein
MKTKIASLCIALFAAVSVPKSVRAQDSQSCNLGGTTACLTRENFNATGFALMGLSTGGVGVEGQASNGGIGVRGQAADGGFEGIGVAGISSAGTGPGVYGAAQNTHGVFGRSLSAAASGVYGVNDVNGYGVTGKATNSGRGIYGINTNTAGWAGYFEGQLFALSAFKPGGGPWSATSDARLKKNIKGLEGVLDRLLQLRGVTYEWIEPEKQGNMTGPQIGMIAQEVEKVFPEWVGRDANGYRTLTPRGFEALAVEGMRTLHNENQALRIQVGSLEDRMKKLESNRPALMAGFGPGGLVGLGGIAVAAAVLLTSKRRSAI